MSFKGGMAMPASAKMKNEMGAVIVGYYTDDSQLYIDDDTCGGSGICNFVGLVNLGDLPVSKKFNSLSFAGGASAGIVIGGAPNIRVELDWLHISESNYNASPLFAGDVVMSVGTLSNNVAAARTTSVTDTVSAMFYYDFFSGARKPVGTMIPYVGAGFGYASSTTVLELADIYGDLSGDIWFADFGTQAQGVPVIDFYTSETETNNFSLSAAAGFAYGLDEGVFFDIGARATFIPKVVWALNNSSNAAATTYKERDVFSANDVLYISVYAGVRFEF
jgi:hypothetical protein